MMTKTWPYGTTRRATVKIARWRPNHLHRDSDDGQLLIDELGEAHVCIGGSCADFTARDGDAGTLIFTKGGPTGGFWRFVKDKSCKQ